MMRRLPLFVAAALAFVTLPAVAGDRSLLSSLPTLHAASDATEHLVLAPKKMGVPGLAVKERSYSTQANTRSYIELSAAITQGYCLVARDYGFRLEATSMNVSPPEELWHLVEADGKATLDRTRFEVVAEEKTAWVKSRTSVQLRQVGHSNRLAVWSFREPNGDVVVLARGGYGGRETASLDRGKEEQQTGMLPGVSSGCAFGATRLSGSLAHTGAVARLNGSVPALGDKKPSAMSAFVMDASLSKVARDPEPVLAIRVRYSD